MVLHEKVPLPFVRGFCVGEVRCARNKFFTNLILSVSVGGHVAIVFLKAAGKTVVPVAITHKIKELCVFGM